MNGCDFNLVLLDMIFRIIFGGLLIFFAYAIMIYIKTYQERNFERLRSIDCGVILLFSFFILGLISARGAVRIIMMLVPSTSALVGYLICISVYKSA